MSAYLTRENDWLILSVPADKTTMMRRMTWATWDQARRKYIIKKPNSTIYNTLQNVLPDLVVHRDVEELIKEVALKKEETNNLKDAGWDNIEPRQPLPLKEGVTPFQHQRAAYEVACRILGL